MKPSPITGLAVCARCGWAKNPSEFYERSDRPGKLRSHCKACLSRQNRKYTDRIDRFWKYLRAHTTTQGGCVLWNGSCHTKGYPSYGDGSLTGSSQVHRIVYSLRMGPIPDGMFVTMRCKERRCVNFYHMDLVTREELEVLRCNSAATGMRNGTHTHPEKRIRVAVTAEQRARLRAAAKARWADPAFRERACQSMRGIPKTPEHLEKLRQARLVRQSATK